VVTSYDPSEVYILLDSNSIEFKLPLYLMFMNGLLILALHFMSHLKNTGLKTCMNLRVVMLLCATTLYIRLLGLGISLLNLIQEMF